jgi:hypothetical protein
MGVVIFLALLVVGCSGTGNPVSPIIEGNPYLTGENHESQASDTWLLGYYDIYYDIQTRTFEAELNRNIGYTLNIVPFLNLMTIPKYGITFGSLVVHDDDPTVLGIDVDFNIYHPFPGLDQYSAYDIRGVVIGNASNSLSYDGITVANHGTDLWMKNPDGYTRWFNPMEFTTDKIFGYCPGGFQNLAGDAMVNPYKYYSKHLGADDNLWSYLTGSNNWDGFFESGSGRRMELEFPLPPDGIGLKFGYAVVVCWEEQGPIGPYHPVHVSEPVAASVLVTPNIWYNETEGSGGDLILDIDLFSWDEQPSVVKIESSVLDNIAEFDFDSCAMPGGDHYSTWHVEAPVGILNTAENHYFWVIAECQSSDYNNGLPEIPSSDGTLAAFFRYDLEVGSEPYNHPCEDIMVVSADPSSMASGGDYAGVEIMGNYFFDNLPMEVDLVDGTTVLASATNVQWLSGTSLTCDISMCGVSPGDFQLRVKNGCAPDAYGYLDYTIDPDPLKNINLRQGIAIRDLSVCMYSHEPFVIFIDGEIYIYDENYSDYQTNTGTGDYTPCNLICTQNPYDDPPTGDHAYPTIGSNVPGIGGFLVYYRDTHTFVSMGSDYVLDVIGMYGNTRHYSLYNSGSTFTPVRKNLAPPHGGFWGAFLGNCGSGDGLINKAAVVGVDISYTLNNPPNPAPPYNNYQTRYWMYFLEASPDLSVERCHYVDKDIYDNTTHLVIPEGTYLHNGELIDPRDICTDLDNNVFILDVDSSGQAVIRVYDEDLIPLGVVGDASSISGDPLRIDNDDDTQSVHVAHSDGVSIFRKCELPI